MTPVFSFHVKLKKPSFFADFNILLEDEFGSVEFLTTLEVPLQLNKVMVRKQRNILNIMSIFVVLGRGNVCKITAKVADNIGRKNFN